MHLLAALGLVLLHGVVMRGPTTPVCKVGVPCSAPAAHVKLVFGRVVTWTDARGRYSVRLRPGRYVVRVARIRPATIVVTRAARADFFIDTGIR